MTAQNQSPPTERIRGISKANALQLTQIVAQVADEAGLETRSIYGPDRDMYAVAFRRALWWCFRDGYGMTYENISKLFKSHNGGHFNHSAIMAGITKVRVEGMMVFSEHKGQWIERGSEQACSDHKLRQALQIVAQIWNSNNPYNQLKTWKNLV